MHSYTENLFANLNSFTRGKKKKETSVVSSRWGLFVQEYCHTIDEALHLLNEGQEI